MIDIINIKEKQEDIMIQAIFFDIDGTLASFQTHQVSRSTFQTLKALKKARYQIIYCDR